MNEIDLLTLDLMKQQSISRRNSSNGVFFGGMRLEVFLCDLILDYRGPNIFDSRSGVSF